MAKRKRGELAPHYAAVRFRPRPPSRTRRDVVSGLTGSLKHSRPVYAGGSDSPSLRRYSRLKLLALAGSWYSEPLLRPTCLHPGRRSIIHSIIILMPKTCQHV